VDCESRGSGRWLWQSTWLSSLALAAWHRGCRADGSASCRCPVSGKLALWCGSFQLT